MAVAALLGAGYFFLTGRSHHDAGRAVAGQLRNTFPDLPSTGWRVNSAAIFEGAAFVRPDATSYQYLRPGFIDLGDTLITAAVLPQTDRGATLVAIDAESGDVNWTADAGFHPVCAAAAVDGLLPCLGQESHFGPPGLGAPPYVHFLRISDGAVTHRIAVAEETRAVEVHDSAVYTMSYDYSADVRSMTRGTTDALDAGWRRSYPVGDGSQSCPGSGDTTYDGVDHDVVYSGNDGGMVVADAADGERLLPGEVTELKVFPGQGFTARLCRGGDPDSVDTAIVDTQGNVLREVAGAVARPWLVDQTANVPYIVDRTAYDFATGRELWTASGGVPELHTIVGDTVLGGGGRGEGPLTAFDLATGRQLWTSRVDVGDLELSDGRRVMGVTADGLVAVDLATGEEAWSMAGTGGRMFLGRAGTGFASAAAEVITFYPPTGGPAGSPGRGGGDEAADASVAMVTKCGRTPELRPVEYRAENGALVVVMEVKARCPGGDVVSTNRLRVTIRDERGLICSATFDFSRDPLVLGPEDSGPVLVELTFGSGTYSRHPNTLGDNAGRQSGGEIVTQAGASGDEVVECEDEGTTGGVESAPGPAVNGPQRSASSDPPGTQISCGSDADTMAALRAQVDADRPYVQSSLADRWVAQLSSKQPGLIAPDVDGRVVTWTPCEILQQHLRMRGQYPEVRLVWSDEWRTFDLRGWWVTIAGVTFPDAGAANGWCDARTIPIDECYAKVISNSRDSRGTTDYRR
ncbi:PQQ-binding-like beta-propeller repeat protein [Mycobacterium sp. GA-2829]|uniref:outer membrane protein assembly factor BamB family protein n=1 Tax=Mycobacterium sp. GA-2829 TaxID=1772283 RepID=UPI0018D25B5C|nr:PQQ-binding-like beta-propeller repeat protein [Mycobacterium sp. GA-2829]